MIRAKISLLILMVLALAACTPQGGLPDTSTEPSQTAPAATDEGTPIMEVTQPAPDTTGEAQEGVLPPAVVQEVQRRISESLNLPVEQVEIISAEQANWRDSCMELGGPAESCAQVITPGWRVLLSVDGQEYEVRTDEMGTQVRWIEKEPAQ
jgi:hypothetical protein